MTPTESSALSPTAQRALEDARGILLDVGCGANKQPGAFGMDVRPVHGVDLVWDLTQTPWPLPDNCAHTVVLSHVWEHIPPWRTLAVMEEVHRVCRPNAGVFIAGPYGLGYRYVQDPTHCNPVNESTFEYWDPSALSGLYQVYKPSPFAIRNWTVIPAGNDRDFNCVLSCLKPVPATPTLSRASRPTPKPSRRNAATGPRRKRR